MKAKELFYAVGLKPRPREYGYDIVPMDLPKYGRVDYAMWRHPKAELPHYKDEEIDRLRAFLNPGDVAIDIGAHSGDTTIPMGLAVGREGLVLALEPNPHVFKILLANVALNVSSTRIIPVMAAASDKDADVVFNYSDPGYCNGGYHKDVPARKHAHFFKMPVHCINLERYIARHHPEVDGRIRYVKIDTEGHDFTVARAIQGLLEANRPYLSLEINRHTDMDHRRRFYRYLTDLGYRVHDHGERSDYQGELLTEDKMGDRIHFDIFAVP
ncbi:MAG: FkbM family methyltransferase [Pseudomonadota bacterium]